VSGPMHAKSATTARRPGATGMRCEAMARQATGSVVERQRRDGRVFALRFRAYGRRHYVTLGSEREGWTQRKAELELANTLADVRRGIWKPASAPAKQPADPTFHEFASEWLATRRHEFAPRTVEDYELALTHHRLPFFAEHRLSEITAQEVDRYKALKVREREDDLVERPLSNRTINKTLTRLGQILDVAVRYELIDHNPVKTKVAKLKEAQPQRTRLSGEQVQALLRAAGPNRALLATAIMAGGLRVSELTHLRWRDIDLRDGTLSLTASKTSAGIRAVSLEPELVQVLREHKIASQWSQQDDLVFPGRFRDRTRERNSVRTRVLHGAIERANEVRGAGQACDPQGRHLPLAAAHVRRTPRGARRAPGDHSGADGPPGPADDPPRLHDVTGMKPQTRMGGLLSDAEWAPMGTNGSEAGPGGTEDAEAAERETRMASGRARNGSDGTRTRGLRRDRPAL
jgi:integrase